MPTRTHVHFLRVRYSETDQMRTYYNSRVFDWFECGRTELCRATGKPYTQWEEAGVLLPVTEAHAEYLGPARYDDPLKITTILSMIGRARMRFDVVIEHAETGAAIARGYTIHAITDTAGKPIRPPAWVRHVIDTDERPADR